MPVSPSLLLLFPSFISVLSSLTLLFSTTEIVESMTHASSVRLASMPPITMATTLCLA